MLLRVCRLADGVVESCRPLVRVRAPLPRLREAQLNLR